MYKSLDSLSKFFYWGAALPLFLALFTPLLINSDFLFPFITPKTLFFRVVVEISLFFYILLAVKRPEFRPKLTPLSATVLLFFAIVTVASLFGVNLYKSFWGNIERGEGLLTLYHIFGFFFIATQVFRDKKIWTGFLNTAVLVTLIASFHGLLQKIGVESIINTTGRRVAATIGNASFFGGFLLFGIFLSLLLFSFTKNKFLRVFYALVALFETYMLALTETRGAFLGLVSGLVLVAIIQALFGTKKIKQYSTIFLVSIVAIGSLIWIQKDSELVKNIPILARLTTISFEDITTQSRLLTWESSWQGLNDRPLLGYGWENYNVAYNKYFNPEIYRDAGSQIWFDRAHNIIFDVSVTSGYIGLVVYLSVFVMAIRVLWKRYKENKESFSFGLLAGLLLAYLVQNLFVFDVLATYIAFYCLLGYISFLELRKQLESTEPATEKFPVLPKLLPGISAVAIVLLVSGIYFFSVKPAQANLTAVEALIAQNTGRQVEAGELFRTAIDYKTNQTAEIRQKYAEYAIALANSNFSNQEVVKSEFVHVINQMKETIKEYPLDVQYYMFLMILYNRSSNFDPNRLDLLLKVGEKALELSPTRPQIYYELGQAYMTKGDSEKGIEAFQKALDLQPEAIESHWNLAAAYILAGQKDKAEEEFAWLETKNFKYDSPQNLRRMIPVYNSAQDWEGLADVYETLAEQEPNNPNWFATLAATYAKLNEKEKARQAVERAVELEPSLQKDAEAFLQSLDAQN